MVGVASSTLVSRSIFLLLFLLSSTFGITIKEALSEQILAKYPNIEILNLEILTPQNLPNDIASFKLNSVQILNLSSSTARAVFSKDDTIKNINFKFQLQANIDIIISNRNILKSEPISEENTHKTKIKFAEFKQEFLSQIPKNAIAKHNIKALTPLKLYNITFAKDILKGNTIILQVQDGTLSVQINAIALNDANIGQIIEAKAGKKRYKALVISKTHAIVK